MRFLQRSRSNYEDARRHLRRTQHFRRRRLETGSVSEEETTWFYTNITWRIEHVVGTSRFVSGIKVFSNWPTIPQVYFKGDFIGGCDILLQMHQNGELIEELEKIGIKSALVKEEEK